MKHEITDVTRGKMDLSQACKYLIDYPATTKSVLSENCSIRI
jgi:hypothetical protein